MMENKTLYKQNEEKKSDTRIIFAPLLAQLAFRPGELLSSLFVRRSSVNISHFNSEEKI
jgi:hypothetical protein